jgi:hypothetical protein
MRRGTFEGHNSDLVISLVLGGRLSQLIVQVFYRFRVSYSSCSSSGQTT